jgi:hypothetical protein
VTRRKNRDRESVRGAARGERVDAESLAYDSRPQRRLWQAQGRPRVYKVSPSWVKREAEIALTEHGVEPGSISGWVAEETGYAVVTVAKYLDSKYKAEQQSEAGKLGKIALQARPLETGVLFDISKSLEKAFDEVLPVVDLESPGGLHRAAKALEREAEA